MLPASSPAGHLDQVHGVFQGSPVVRSRPSFEERINSVTPGFPVAQEPNFQWIWGFRDGLSQACTSGSRLGMDHQDRTLRVADNLGRNRAQVQPGKSPMAPGANDNKISVFGSVENRRRR